MAVGGVDRAGVSTGNGLWNVSGGGEGRKRGFWGRLRIVIDEFCFLFSVVKQCRIWDWL